MAYEPTGKVKPFVEAARAQPQRVWTGAEIARLLGVPQSSVGSWLTYPMNARVIHRGRRGSETVYSATEFPPEAAYPPVARRNGGEEPSTDDHRARPPGNTWTPPRMTAPREGSDVRHVNPPRPAAPPPHAQSRLCPGCERPVCSDKGCVAERLHTAFHAGGHRNRCGEPGPHS